ncbi:MAG: hypothetical protein RIS64_4233, partial [Bacteroidota bacterium]
NSAYIDGKEMKLGNLMFINGVSKETTELLIEVQKLRAEKEGFIKEVTHLKKIIDLLEKK